MNKSKSGKQDMIDINQTNCVSLSDDEMEAVTGGFAIGDIIPTMRCAHCRKTHVRIIKITKPINLSKINCEVYCDGCNLSTRVVDGKVDPNYNGIPPRPRLL